MSLKQELNKPAEIKLVTYNIQYSKGRDGKYDLERAIEAVKGADIIALQEVERNWPRTGMEDQPLRISEMLPDHYAVYGPYLDIHTGKKPGGIEGSQRQQFGNMLLSRWPILFSRNHLFPRCSTLLVPSMPTGAIEGTVRVNGEDIRFSSAHLSAVSSEERQMQIEYLRDLQRNILLQGGCPISGPRKGRWTDDWYENMPETDVSLTSVLMGDFNMTTNMQEYSMLTGTKDPSYGYAGHVDQYLDSWVWAPHDNPDEERPLTWESTSPQDSQEGLKGALDYIFVSPNMGERIISASVDNKAQGSDHYPYRVELACS